MAVLLVVCFHAFPTWLRGGLIGVDIFFVLSGYLISTIIFENLDNRCFSFVDFYSRRIRRIFPALLSILIFCFVLGWVTLLADEFAQLGKHIAGGAGFISNFFLLNESGYFDNASDTKPLLHLWSLGIEEQFYIVWPLLLWVAWKRNFNLLFITVMVGVISFVLNISTISDDTVAAFYLPHTRFWELLAGAILAYVKLYKNNYLFGNGKSAISFLGVALLGVGLFVVNPESLFPGWLALFPVSGTVLILLAGPNALFNKKILANPMLVWVGLISYPLYLWHWPLLSFARIIQGGHPEIRIRGLAVGISIILAWLTYQFIEKPVRYGSNGGMKTLLVMFFMLGIGFAGYFSYNENGFYFREVVQMNPDINSQDGGGFGKKASLKKSCGIADPEKKKLIAFCHEDRYQPPVFALMGDSKAAAMYPAIYRTSVKTGPWMFICGNNSNGSPAPILSENGIYARYQNLANIAVNAISKKESVSIVVLVAATRVLFDLKTDKSINNLPENTNYNAAFEGLGNTVRKLIGAGKKVVLVVDNPTLADPRDCMDRETSVPVLNRLLVKGANKDCSISLRKHLALSQQYRELLREVAAIDPVNIRVFDTMEYLCDIDDNVCRSHKNGHQLYSYSDHVSDYAAGLIGEGLNQFLLEWYFE